MSMDKLEASPVGIIESNFRKNIDVYIEEPALDSRKCLGHCVCKFSDLEADYLMGGLVYPNDSEPNIYRFRFECPGPNIFNKCNLKIVQYDSDGKELGSMRTFDRKIKTT